MGLFSAAAGGVGEAVDGAGDAWTSGADFTSGRGFGSGGVVCTAAARLGGAGLAAPGGSGRGWKRSGGGGSGPFSSDSGIAVMTRGSRSGGADCEPVYGSLGSGAAENSRRRQRPAGTTGVGRWFVVGIVARSGGVHALGIDGAARHSLVGPVAVAGRHAPGKSQRPHRYYLAIACVDHDAHLGTAATDCRNHIDRAPPEWPFKRIKSRRAHDGGDFVWRQDGRKALRPGSRRRQQQGQRGREDHSIVHGTPPPIFPRQ